MSVSAFTVLSFFLVSWTSVGDEGVLYPEFVGKCEYTRTIFSSLDVGSAPLFNSSMSPFRYDDRLLKPAEYRSITLLYCSGVVVPSPFGSHDMRVRQTIEANITLIILCFISFLKSLNLTKITIFNIFAIFAGMWASLQNDGSSPHEIVMYNIIGI